MNTLIIPCAGKSSRFPNTRAKFLLTHPDGDLLVQKALCGLNLDIFSRIIIVITKPFDERFEAGLILRQCFGNTAEICVLDDFTKSVSETVALCIKKMRIKGAFVVKDADNFVQVTLPQNLRNLVVACDLHSNPQLTNISAKSFLKCNEQGIVIDIIEKQVVSNLVSVGVYVFENAEIFVRTFDEMCMAGFCGEMFISHIISYLICVKNITFAAILTQKYDDFGTLEEFRRLQTTHKSYFVDFDGVLIKNSGKFGSLNWQNNKNLIMENIETLKELQKKGAQIIITTSRPSIFEGHIYELLQKTGLKPFAILTGLNHSPRVLINDFAPSNAYPSASAISLPRNTLLKDYLSNI